MKTALLSLLLLLLLLLLASLCAGFVLLVRALWQGAQKRRLLAGAHGIGCNLAEPFGISVLGSGIDDEAAIERLLLPEYSRYEVVVVLDRAESPEEFLRIVTRFRMIRVEWSGPDEGSPAAIRTLWRSRRRSCRRLVVVDRPHDPLERLTQQRRYADWNAAASVAAYDYLLPIEAGIGLLPDAVTRLVAELGERPAGTLRLVQTHIGVPVQLYARDAVLDAGGFGPQLRKRIPLRQRAELWEPLACRVDHPTSPRLQRRQQLCFRILFVAACAATGVLVAAGHWIWAAITATLAVAAAAGLAARPLTESHEIFRP